ncbi:MAG: hypothetical protein EHM53_07300 [Methanoregulaceae archaeon]|nr:MAG: hypothetical protein EHM53_07300 [Methanoregulaceae archaeon]
MFRRRERKTSRQETKIFAIANRCTHRGCLLSSGTIQRKDTG